MGVYISLLVFVFGMLVIQEKVFKINNHNGLLLAKNEMLLRKISFFSVAIILGLFSAIRDGIGIDYISYIRHIQNIALGMPNYMEPGFQYLTKIIMSFTQDARLVLGAAAIITVYFYISAIYKYSKDIKMSVFLFLTWGYYFFTFNTVRNYLALSIVLFAVSNIFDKKYLKFILWAIIASSFHKTALVCIPFYIIARRKLSKQTYLLIVLASILLLLFKDRMRDIMFWFYPHYEGTVYDVGRVSVLNIFKSSLVLIYGAIYYTKIKSDIKLRTFYNLNFFSLILYTSLYWLPEVSRIGFYFNIVSILLIPNLTKEINKKDQVMIKFLIYLFSIILFILLMRGFYNPTNKLLPYKTWLF